MNFNTNKLVRVPLQRCRHAQPRRRDRAEEQRLQGRQPVNCGTSTVSGNMLTIIFKTTGNGKTRLLG